MVETIPFLYTSQAEMESILSVEGVRRRIDDEETGEPSLTEEGYLDDIIREATDELNLFLLDLYDPEDLTESFLVRRWTSYVGCVLLSLRRNEDVEHYKPKMDMILDRLNLIRSGRMNLPRTPRATKPGPTLSNQVIDRRYPTNKARTVAMEAVGDTSATNLTWSFER